ncbi:MAG: NUDIX hydrolase [Candidatus Omnitrophota bacterium]
MKKHKNYFKGKILHVATKSVRLPNGHVANIDIVKHPGAVLIVPLFSNNRVILLRQYRPVIKKYIYELPAGTLEKGESPVACAKREIIEETGFSAKRLSRLSEIIPVPGYSTEKIFIYKAEDLVKTEQLCQKDEVIETFVFTKRQIQKMLKNGKIIDAKTICGFALCGWLKEVA